MFDKLKLVHWGKEVENQLSRKQNLFVTVDRTCIKIFSDAN